jgi:hypothetical protein
MIKKGNKGLTGRKAMGYESIAMIKKGNKGLTGRKAMGYESMIIARV